MKSNNSIRLRQSQRETKNKVCFCCANSRVYKSGLEGNRYGWREWRCSMMMMMVEAENMQHESGKSIHILTTYYVILLIPLCGTLSTVQGGKVAFSTFPSLQHPANSYSDQSTTVNSSTRTLISPWRFRAIKLFVLIEYEFSTSR